MSSSSAQPKLQNISIHGPIDVKRLPLAEIWSGSRVLLMGPTGAGKSSFIEALAGPNSTVKNIASGQLEGFTQDVTAYKIEGIRCRDERTWLIDTPGFADDKISTIEIVAKVQAFSRATKGHYSMYFSKILFFTPVTSTRLPESQRQVVEVVKALTGPWDKVSAGLTIVTTMWDTLYGEQAEIRATNNFAQLNNDIWKEYTGDQTKMTKFYNTQASVLEILDSVFEKPRGPYFRIDKAINAGSTRLLKTKYSTNLHTDLMGRIQALYMRRSNIISDLADKSVAGNFTQELEDLLNEDLTQVNSTIARFERQLDEFVNNRPITLSGEKGRLSRIKDSTKSLAGKIWGDPRHGSLLKYK